MGQGCQADRKVPGAQSRLGDQVCQAGQGSHRFQEVQEVQAGQGSQGVQRALDRPAGLASFVPVAHEVPCCQGGHVAQEGQEVQGLDGRWA